MNLLYFAYGANMSHGHMRGACAKSRFLKRAYLEDHKFVYDGYSDYLRKRSLANVVDLPGGVVWGGLYEVNESDAKSLDNSEGCPGFYEKKSVVVKDDEGKSYEAIVYSRARREPGAPSPEHRQIVVQGGKDCKLPKDYLIRIAYKISG